LSRRHHTDRHLRVRAPANQETWAHTLVDGGLAWHGDRIYAITEQLSEPDNVTLRIRDLGQ
jgi:hypothetical protein